MNLLSIRDELESELTWRRNELRFLKNQLAHLRTKDERDQQRRTLVLMLYAHFEGFWKASFSIYVKAINSEAITCGDAIDHLVAAAMYKLLMALADSQMKHSFFKKLAPFDEKLHRLHRHVQFLSGLPDINLTTLDIPTDRVVDTESNLWPIVIRKNLFRLGFPYDLFAAHEGTVQRLVNARNSIGHGASLAGVEESKYTDMENAVFDIMEAIVRLVFNSLYRGAYLRRPWPDYVI